MTNTQKQKSEEFNLSEHIFDANTESDEIDLVIREEYVKEFIRRLKDKVKSNAFLTASGNPRYDDWLLEQIDKLAGEKLCKN